MDLRRVPDIVNLTTMKQTRKKRVFHLRRVGLFSSILLAFLIVRFDAGKLPAPLRPPYVLAYATDMSREGLLADTNAARSTAGLAPFRIDGQLNTSAQTKAQDMLSKDYWAHVSPDGTEPWYFFNQAGYSYTRASENLAYGFMSSQGVVDGWMNSASHRDNMLGQYNDVGFGIVNIPNYQSSGEQTLVVAHYGVRYTPPAATVASTATPPAQSTPQAEATTTAPAAATSDTVTPATTAAASESDSSQAQAEKLSTQTVIPPVQTAATSRISVLGMLGRGSLSAVALLALGIIGLSTIGLAATHRHAFKHALVTGEHFVVAHPGMDTALVAAATTLILTTTYGTIG